MIAADAIVAGGRRARLFVRDQPGLPRNPADLIQAAYWDEEDQAREPVLRALLEQRPTRALAFRTTGLRDVLQVFLLSGDERVFACTVVSGGRLRTMLEESPSVIEGFTFQVAQGDHLSVEGVRAAVQEWVERTFPGVIVPAIALEWWTGPEGVPEDILKLLLMEPPPLDELGPTIVEPDADIAQPPYRGAA